MLLGCIADDLTGATDLSGTLVAEGMRVVQLLGVPPDGEHPPAGTDAVVVALKTRSAPVADAVDQSLRALRWLVANGCRSVFLKYCSTFDSTPAGNIGPVADAILAELGQAFTIVSPAFPRTGRTVYLGHLFVGSDLLSDSGMRHHPVTPMSDSSLPRLLGRQTDGVVGVVEYPVVSRGPAAIRAALDRMRADGTRYAVVDALEDRHLAALAEAYWPAPLATGGSAIARAIAAWLGRTGAFNPASTVDIDAGWPGPVRATILAGSCSEATLAQIGEASRRYPALAIDPARLAGGQRGDVVSEAVAWAAERLADGPVLVYTSAGPADAARVRHVLGERGSELIEQALGAIARGLREAGLNRLVVAGGETSGAVAAALGVRSLRVGPEIEPGVPVTWAATGPPLGLVFKSGNFGSPGFFAAALHALGVRG